ncbi:hypothetical protein EIP91_002870 [Steccherinum ochraceum]|uniref:Small ribosomal subunit protein mS41 n=1 Tax=Steccherinum ochraceum TaxID=92696 RepID=A0A4R0RV51_9APHY|nr:hypothetical protein EIP91_002870 [Steccherinum ochraceum]
MITGKRPEGVTDFAILILHYHHPSLRHLCSRDSAMASLLGLRLASLVPRQCRSLVNHAASRPVPPARGAIKTPAAFLTAIGRSSETKLPTVPESWNDLWKLDGHALKEAGLYILWSMEKYRLGEDPKVFAHAPRKRRKIRGRGPAVQDGKRIRSRRL